MVGTGDMQQLPVTGRSFATSMSQPCQPQPLTSVFSLLLRPELRKHETPGERSLTGGSRLVLWR